MPGIATGNRLGNGLRFIASQNNEVDGGGVSLYAIADSTTRSLSAIFILTTLGSYCLISKDNSSGAGFRFGITAGNIYFQVVDSTNQSIIKSISANVNFQTGVIYHAVAIKDGADVNNWKLYLNGQLLVSTVVSTGIPNTISGNNASLFFGSTGNGARLNGVYYDAKMITRVITNEEIIKIYTSDGTKSGIEDTDFLFDIGFEEKEGLLVSSRVGSLVGELKNFINISLGPFNQWVDNLQQPILS